MQHHTTTLREGAVTKNPGESTGNKFMSDRDMNCSAALNLRWVFAPDFPPTQPI